MPVLLIIVGLLAGGFMLATFQQVPIVGCFASSVFYNEIRVFNVPTRDPFCISAQLYYVGMIGGFVLAGIGVALAVAFSGGAAPARAPEVGHSSYPAKPVSTEQQSNDNLVARYPASENAEPKMPTLRRLVKMEITRREAS